VESPPWVEFQFKAQTDRQRFLTPLGLGEFQSWVEVQFKAQPNASEFLTPKGRPYVSPGQRPGKHATIKQKPQRGGPKTVRKARHPNRAAPLGLWDDDS
jgi:hypothetical protein